MESKEESGGRIAWVRQNPPGKSFLPWRKGLKNTVPLRQQKEAVAMTVEVIFKNGRKGYVNRSELNMLINSRLIQSFKRADGWVRIGSDPLRQRGDLSYSGEEKRAHY
jgi:hypothetical protein